MRFALNLFTYCWSHIHHICSKLEIQLQLLRPPLFIVCHAIETSVWNILRNPTSRWRTYVSPTDIIIHTNVSMLLFSLFTPLADYNVVNA